MPHTWNFAQRPPWVVPMREKKKLTKFLNILRTNGKSSKNEKSKFCKNLYIRLIFEKSFKIFLTPLETILHTHSYSHAKFCGITLTIRHKKTLKSLEKWVSKFSIFGYLDTFYVAMAKRFIPSAQNFAH